MMDITSASMEFQLNIDFASAYQESPLCRYIILPLYFAFDDQLEINICLN
jgi:hypothetical protein